MGIYIDEAKIPKPINADMLILVRCNGTASISETGVQRYNAKAIDLDLVRCGECVWHGENDTCIHRDGLIIARDDDFCSLGERSTDEADR